MKNTVKLVVGLILGLIAFIIIWPFGIINAGERGVQLRFGAVTGTVLNRSLLPNPDYGVCPHRGCEGSERSG